MSSQGSNTCSRRAARWLAPLFLLGALGCAASHPVPRDLSNQASLASMADQYWKRHGVPDMQSYGYKRVAIVSFSVEYVLRRVEAPLTTVETRYPEKLLSGLADQCYADFVRALGARRLEVVSPEQIEQTGAYRSLVPLLNLERPAQGLASDLGRIKRVRVRAPRGQHFVERARDVEIESVEARILDELAADVAVRVRIRVGASKGRLSIERGSTIWVLSSDVVGNLTADRSLLSDETVYFAKEGGSVYSANTQAVLDAARRMFPAFLEMAFLSGK